MAAQSVIRGVGLVTTQGLNATSTWNAILAGCHLLDHGRVAVGLNDRPRVTQLGLRAVREAIGEAGWGASDPARTALVVGTSKGAIEDWIETARSAASSPLPGSRRSKDFSEFGIASLASDLIVDLALPIATSLTFSAACASGIVALIRAHLILLDNLADRVIVVASESSLSDLFVGSFDRLGVLAPAGYGCRPFDKDRRGFYLAEAAAAVCLERAIARPGDVTIDRCALGGDAIHLTALDPDAATLRHILRRVIDDRPVDLVHAHGTATPLNDAVELKALEAELPSTSSASLFSHKAALGHTQGAAGLIAVVVNVLAHRSGMAPPMPTKNPEFVDRLALSATVRSGAIRRSLAIASGFGGPVAGISLHSSE